MGKALSLSTVFSAIDRLSGPVKTMTTSVTRFGKAGKIAGKVAGVALKAGAAIGAASLAAGAAVGKAAESFATKGDEIAKSARMFGMTTDALQELRYAAGMQGVETASLDVAFKQLNNNLGQLKTGEGALYTRLSKTNPALARQLRTARDTDAAFGLMMDAIKAEGNAAKRAALAQAAFGKSGQELIKFAEAGSEGIAALRAEAHTYGLVIDKSAAEKSEAFSDSLSRLKQSAASLANQGLGRVVEKMQPLLQRAADWIAANKVMLGQKLDQVFSTIERTASALSPVFQALTPALEPLWNLVMSLAPAFEGVAKVAAAVLGPVFKIIGSIADGISGLLGGKMTGEGFDFRGAADAGLADMGFGAGAVPLSPQAAALESRSYSESRSTLDVTFAGAPAGTTYKQSGHAPGITVNTGSLMPSGGAH